MLQSEGPNIGQLPLKVVIALFVCLSSFATPGRAIAQPQSATISGFVQAGWSAQVHADAYGLLPESHFSADVGNTFQIVQSRLRVDGSDGGQVGYTIEAGLLGGVSLLQALIHYSSSDRLSLVGGQMLKPFGRDRTRYRNKLISFDRTYSSLRIANDLQYGSWDTGIMARFYHGQGGLLSVGVFNGRSVGPKADNDTGKNVVGRVLVPLGGITFGGSLSILHINSLPPGKRDHVAWGVDALLGSDRSSLEIEFLSASEWVNYDPVAGGFPKQIGYAATGSVRLGSVPTKRSNELVLRIERFDPSGDTDKDAWVLVVPTLNMSIEDSARLQLGMILESPEDRNLQTAITVVAVWQVDFP